MKTNAMRVLDKLKIKYEIKEYAVDNEHLDAVHVAMASGVAIEKIYKTIVCDSGGEFLVACVQGDLSLDLKALAKFAGVKRCELLHLKDLTKITGYIRGGCSPLAMKKKFRTFIDSRAILQEIISVSAGIRGMQILLSPQDLALSCEAKFCEIAV